MAIAVIGAGASGMAAALQAAWNGAEVTLFEHNGEVGKKLLVTGSGRCNLTNDGVTAARYACGDPAWMEALIAGFGVRDVLDMLAAIGVPAHSTPDGWYYPISNSAASVVAAFESALALAGVDLALQSQVTSIDPGRQGFTVGFTRDGKAQQGVFERVILSAGGLAYPALGSRGELFPALARLGHSVLPKRPALAPLLVELGFLRALQGLRLNVGASLWQGKHQLAATQGNLIITEWGLNGPAVMDLSHHVSSREGQELELSLDLLAYFPEEFERLLAAQRGGAMPARVLLGAFFLPKISAAYLRNAGLEGATPLRLVSQAALQRLVAQLRDTRLRVKGVRGFEYCQVSAGGVPVGEVDALTLESRRVKGLYLTGETLDVVGPCGGYNLQYAFSSGALAGRAAAAAGGIFHDRSLEKTSRRVRRPGGRAVDRTVAGFQRGVEELRGRGGLNDFQQFITTQLYRFDLPPVDFPVRSILVTAGAGGNGQPLNGRGGLIKLVGIDTAQYAVFAQ